MRADDRQHYVIDGCSYDFDTSLTDSQQASAPGLDTRFRHPPPAPVFPRHLGIAKTGSDRAAALALSSPADESGHCGSPCR